MTRTQYSELVEFIKARFDSVDGRLNNLENTQDHILGELIILSEDKIVNAHRSIRMETWIQKAAKKINMPYNP